MPAFKDAKGRSWEVVVSTTTVARIRDLLKIDPMDVADRESKLLDRLSADPVLLVNMLYVTVKPEADKAGVTDEEFGRAIYGQSLYDAIPPMAGRGRRWPRAVRIRGLDGGLRGRQD